MIFTEQHGQGKIFVFIGIIFKHTLIFYNTCSISSLKWLLVFMRQYILYDFWISIPQLWLELRHRLSSPKETRVPVISVRRKA